MGNGVSTDQGNLPTHDKRDVSGSADKEQYDWSEQAEAPETNSLLAGRKPYANNGLLVCCFCKTSSINFYANVGHSSTSSISN